MVKTRKMRKGGGPDAKILRQEGKRNVFANNVPSYNTLKRRYMELKKNFKNADIALSPNSPNMNLQARFNRLAKMKEF